jgi:hypothetical protein
MTTPELAIVVMQYAIAPLWLAAGCADWYWHRATRIQYTSGFPESLLHAVMLAEIGLPFLAVVFFDTNSLVLALALGGLLLHTLTTYGDLAWSHPRREIGPGEQMAHCLLAVLPLLACVLLVIFTWPTVLSLGGWDGVPRDWRLRVREQLPLGPATVVALAAGALLVGGLYGEELLRTWRGQEARTP